MFIGGLDLVGERTQIDFGIDIAVEDAGFFGEQVAHRLIVPIILEKRLLTAALQPLEQIGAAKSP